MSKKSVVCHICILPEVSMERAVDKAAKCTLWLAGIGCAVKVLIVCFLEGFGSKSSGCFYRDREVEEVHSV